MISILLMSLLAVMLPQTAASKEMPEEVLDTKGSIQAIAALKQPNRVYIEGRKIERAIYDTTILKVERDELTGSLYAVPLTKEKTGLFVVSDSGATHSVTLSPMDKITPQTIALKDKGSTPARSSLASGCTSLPLEAQVQSILKMIPSLSEETSEPLRAAITDGYLIANPLSSWRVSGFTLERYRAFNPTEEAIEVRESGFRQKGVVAVATEARELGPKASADLWLIREEKR